MPDSINDNNAEAGMPPRPDPHGQAAYLLTECLIHTLVEGSVITRKAAVELVDVAIEVRSDPDYDARDTPSVRESSVALLERLLQSLQTDPT